MNERQDELPRQRIRSPRLLASVAGLSIWLLTSRTFAEQGMAGVAASSAFAGLPSLGTIAGWLLLGLTATIAASFGWEHFRWRPTAEDARLLFSDD